MYFPDLLSPSHFLSFEGKWKVLKFKIMSFLTSPENINKPMGENGFRIAKQQILADRVKVFMGLSKKITF